MNITAGQLSDFQHDGAVAFQFLTVRGAPANSSRNRRRAFPSRWNGDDCRWARRDGTASPPFPGLTLSPADPMNAPEFPLVFTAAGGMAAQEPRNERTDLAG